MASPSLQWLSSLFLTLFLSSLYQSSSSKNTSFYTHHCGSIVPESSATNLLSLADSFHISNGFFSSNGRLHDLLYPSIDPITYGTTTKTFYFQPGQVHQTHDTGILKLEGTLVLLGSWAPQNISNTLTSYEDGRRRAIFKLSGFWSESAGKLCMVGTGQIRPEGLSSSDSVNSAVLTLEYPKVSNITTSIVRGKIETLDSVNSPSHFAPISLLAYAQKTYEYTLIDQAKQSCSFLPDHEELISMHSSSLCSTLQTILPDFSFISSELMNPIGSDFILMSQIQCLGDDRVHISMALSNESLSLYDGRPIMPGKSLVAEGVWDYQRKRLCLIACMINSREDSLTSTSVGDCSLGFSFWFPATFSLKKRNIMVGHMWNTKEKNKTGYTKVIDLFTTRNYNLVVPELKYKYTELEAAKKYCKTRKEDQTRKEKYPDMKSFNDMRFSLHVRDANGKSSYGSAEQVSIGETYYGNPNGGFIYRNNMYTTIAESYHSPSVLVDQNSTIHNVGYNIHYYFRGKNASQRAWDEIWAEGIYNSNTGVLCLIGCRVPNFMNRMYYSSKEETKPHADDNNRDCTVFIQLELTPVTETTNEKGSGKGVIRSTRDPSDPLYFKPLHITTSPMSITFSSREFQRINLELVMVVISRTLLCIFAYFQLRHARINSKTLPMVSITMLLILTLGQMIPLILGIEDLLASSRKNRHRFFFRSGGWPDANNAIMRFITMIALYIQIRLLQLRWKSRSTDGINPQGAIWKAEIRSFILCVLVYLLGALIAWFFHSNISQFEHTSWEGLTRYSGLVLDSFLLPQIIFNIFFNSKEKILTPLFYGGITAVRIAPHIYNAYRARRFLGNIDSSYIYANHDADYYSAILDVVIPCEGLIFVVLIFLQQRFGGRCFLPKRLNQREGYELVPQDSNI